jgi:rare lipoprotein A
MGCCNAVTRAPAMAKGLLVVCLMTTAAGVPPLCEAADPSVQHQSARHPAHRGRASQAHTPGARAQPVHVRSARERHNEHVSRTAEKPRPDLSGKQRFGKASFYADSFGGKPMANGVPMDLNGRNAASRTLPLGTQARVTNLETGKSATVVIEDRGPYVDGRIVDLSPATARQIGITKRKGISDVVVAPISVPQPDGTLKRGAAAQKGQPLREASLDSAGKSGARR